MRTERYLNRRAMLKVTGSLGVAGTAGCLGVGGGDETEEDSHGSHLDEPVAHAEVAMLSDDAGHHFNPNIVWVERGGTVTWVNESGSHTATAYHSKYDKPLRIPDAAEPWDSGMYSEEGATFERTFDVDGVYDYFCAPHEFRAMVGSVIVGDPDPHHQPGLEEPQDDIPEEARELLEQLNAEANEAIGHVHESAQIDAAER